MELMPRLYERGDRVPTSRPLFVWVMVLVALIAGSARARVEHIEVVSRTDVLDGKAFGEAGAYRS